MRRSQDLSTTALLERPGELPAQSALTAFYYGKRYYNAGRYLLAQQAFQTVIDDRAEFHPAYIWLARTYLKLGNPRQAYQLLQRALELNGTSGLAFYYLGHVYKTLDHDHDTLKQLTGSDEDPDPTEQYTRAINFTSGNNQTKALVRRGTLYLERYEFHKAQDDFQAAIDLNTNASAHAYRMLGYLKILRRESLQDLEDAVEHLTVSIRRKPNNIQSYVFRAEAYIRIAGKNLESGAYYYAKILANQAGSSIKAPSARGYGLAARELRRIKVIYNRISSPRQPNRYVKNIQRLSISKVDELGSELRSALNYLIYLAHVTQGIKPSEVALISVLREVTSRPRAPREPLQENQEPINRFVSKARMMYLVALGTNRDNPDRKINLYSAAIEISPGAARFYFRRAQVYLLRNREGDLQRAREDFTRAGSLVSSTEQFKHTAHLVIETLGAGENLHEHPQFNDLASATEQPTTLERVEQLYSQGQKAQRRGCHLSAQNSFELCLQMLRQEASLLTQFISTQMPEVAQSERKTGALYEAQIDRVSRLIYEITPKNTLAAKRLFSQAQQHYKQHDYALAAAKLSNATRLNYRYSSAYRLLAKALIKQHKYHSQSGGQKKSSPPQWTPMLRQAYLICQEILILDDHCAEALYLNGKILDELQHFDRALEYYRQVITHGDNLLKSKAFMRIGYVFLRRPDAAGAYERAINEFLNAARLRTSKQAQAYFMTGVVQLFLRKSQVMIASAVANFNTALRYNRKLAIARAFLVEANVRLGARSTHFVQYDMQYIQDQIGKHNAQREQFESKVTVYQALIDRGSQAGIRSTHRIEAGRETGVKQLIRVGHRGLKRHMMNRRTWALLVREKALNLLLSHKQGRTDQALQHQQIQFLSESFDQDKHDVQVIKSGPLQLYFIDDRSTWVNKTSPIEILNALYQVARAKMSAEQYSLAIKKLSQAIELSPYMARFYYTRGRAYQLRCKPRDDMLADADFEMAYLLNPKRQKYKSAAMHDVPSEPLPATIWSSLDDTSDLAPEVNLISKMRKTLVDLGERNGSEDATLADQRDDFEAQLEAFAQQLITRSQGSSTIAERALLTQLRQQVAEMQHALQAVKADVSILNNLIQRERMRQTIGDYVEYCSGANIALGMYYQHLRNKLVAIFKAMQLVGESHIIQRSKYTTEDKVKAILEKSVHSIIATIGVTAAGISSMETDDLSKHVEEMIELVEETLEGIKGGFEGYAAGENASEIAENLRRHHTRHSEEAGLERGAHRLFLFGYQSSEVETLVEQIAFLMLVRYRDSITKLGLDKSQAGKLAECTAARIFAILKSDTIQMHSAHQVIGNILLYIRHRAFAKRGRGKATQIREGLDENDIHGRTGIRYRSKRGGWVLAHRDTAREYKTSAFEFGYCIGTKNEADCYEYSTMVSRRILTRQQLMAPATRRQILENSEQIQRLQDSLELKHTTHRVHARQSSTSSVSTQYTKANKRKPRKPRRSESSDAIELSTFPSASVLNHRQKVVTAYTEEDINPKFFYSDHEISTYLSVFIEHELGGLASVNHQFLLRRAVDPASTEVPRFVVITEPVTPSTHDLTSINQDTFLGYQLTHYLDKDQQSQISGERKTDIFDELNPALQQHEHASADILFLYNIPGHFCLMHINLQKTTQDNRASFVVTVHLMDPLKQNRLGKNQREALEQAIQKGLVAHEPAQCQFKFLRNNHARQQAQGDGTACGAITLDMLKRVALQRPLRTTPYPKYARALRLAQLKTIIQHHEPDNQICINRTKALTLDSKRSNAYVVDRIRLTRQEILPAPQPLPFAGSDEAAESGRDDRLDHITDGAVDAGVDSKTPLLYG